MNKKNLDPNIGVGGKADGKMNNKGQAPQVVPPVLPYPTVPHKVGGAAVVPGAAVPTSKTLSITKDVSLVEVTPKQLHELQLDIENINLQLKRLFQFQEQTYRWNMKHHENMKKIIKSFNVLNNIMRQDSNESSSSSGVSTSRSQETKQLADKRRKNDTKSTNIVFYEKANPSSRDSGQDNNFNQEVIDLYKRYGPVSEELQQLLSDLDYSLFVQLKEESMEIILPVLLKWIKGR
ncbi:hypothetical protein SAMD00019534_060610 [Acytostelium subglobosum LB1]|uniref:hypothetical protein n=1 Tax=Acytostelium subglobosum LB1 TaxID=1410327 RepID=UPI000644B878|nr:hypothetical protein SAMD00019534_060610 [Acytostelium subglobosum LB1]GAM22886.1 hypothetical protein SAMD00019534_060610 [Acytostelium subglobosum LB1]|eukprot:XP_012754113.1 hypothetical protein SAMD00019534_060610 [Acytostelium subglobosum LB1]